MWGTFLSEPLLIVALVGRYPANKLIRRIPILLLYISFTLDACCEPHIVLGRLSTGYPMTRVGWIRVTHPCAGRHRRLQATDMLPLDLHVLSL